MYIIFMDGVECHIKDYETMMWQEPGNLELDSGVLTPHQYLSCLFNNLGYDRCPVDFLWLENNIDVENVEKSQVFDYPITRNAMMITKNYDLFSLIMCIKNWIISNIEKGHVLDPNKSFLLPSSNEIQYNMSNRIKILRSAVLKPKVESWNKCDIFWRRLYNLNPSIDKEYFEKQLVHFEFWSKHVIIHNARFLFISALVDPDILLSIIKQSEIEATTNIHNMYPNIPIALLDEKKIFIEFNRIFLDKANKIETIYRNKGIRGFVKDKYKIYNVDNDRVTTLGSEVNLIYPIDLYSNIVGQDILREIYRQIMTIQIDGEIISFINKYVDWNSLKFVDRMQDEYKYATYRRLYYTLKQMENYKKELLNPKDRLIFSESLYINYDNNAIYSRKASKFYVASSDLILREMSHTEVIKYYNTYLGISVELDPNEIGNSIESPPVPYIDLDELVRNSYNIISNSNLPSFPTIVINPYKYKPNNQELYGFNVLNMVDNIKI